MVSKIFFNNKWNNSLSKKIFMRKSLIDNNIFKYSECNSKDINHVVKSAQIGAKNNKKLSRYEISKYLKKISIKINSNKYKIAKLQSQETGKPLSQSIKEIEYCVKLWFFASQAVKLKTDYKVLCEKNTYANIKNEPVGIVALIIPWNYPMVVTSERLPFILAAGNSIIIKPSEYASQSIIFLLKIINETRLPVGTINLVTGSRKVGQKLVENDHVNMVSFTGSTKVGKEIMTICAKSIKRVSLELGGKNSIIVLKDANIEKAVQATIDGFTSNAGQACVGTSKLIIDKKIYNDFKIRLIKKLNSQKVNYGPITTNKQYQNILNILKKNKKFDKKIIYGSFNKNKKNIVSPIVYSGLPSNSDLNKVELFAPILTITKFNSIKKAINLANDTEYGLASVIFSKKLSLAKKIASEIKCGRIWINNSVKNNYANIPIGGFKQSGLNRECGVEGIKTYSEIKSIIINEKN